MENFSRKKILNASLWNFMGILLIRSINYISIPIFTRLLSQNDLGIVSGYVSYIALIGIFVGFGLNTSIGVARISYTGDYKKFNASILNAAIYWFLLVCAVTNLTYSYIRPIIQIERFWMNYMLLAAFSGYVIDSYFKMNTIDYKFKMNTIIGLVNSLISLMLSVALIHLLADKVLGRLLGQYAFYFVISVIIICYIVRYHPFKVDREALNFSIPVGLPNMVHLASQTIMGQSDRVFILRWCDSSKVAIYTVAYTISSLVQVVWGAINEVWTPWLFRNLKTEKYDAIVRYSKIYLFLLSSVYAIVILICPELTVFLSTAEYVEVKSFSPIIALSSFFIFIYSFLVNIEIYNRKNKYMAIATFVSTVTNIVGNIIFIPIYGYVAAAYTTLFSYFILMIMHYIILTYVIKKNFYKFGTFLPAIGIEVILTVISVSNYNNSLLRWGVATVVAFFLLGLCIKNRKKYLNIFRNIRDND